MDGIPVSVERIAGEGGGSAKIVMGLSDLESSGSSIRSRLKKFKKKHEAIAEAKKANASGGGRAVPARKRWSACRILADFGEAAG